jgi:hypothetical protein
MSIVRCFCCSGTADTDIEHDWISESGCDICPICQEADVDCPQPSMTEQTNESP